MCLEHERIFNPLTISEQFAEFFEHTGRILKVLHGRELESYLNEASWRQIMKHHQQLRKRLNIHSRVTRRESK